MHHTESTMLARSLRKFPRTAVYSKEDLRSAVLLEGVSGADFVHVKFAHAPDIPTFALKNVEGFALNLSRPLPDTYIDKVEQRTL